LQYNVIPECFYLTPNFSCSYNLILHKISVGGTNLWHLQEYHLKHYFFLKWRLSLKQYPKIIAIGLYTAIILFFGFVVGKNITSNNLSEYFITQSDSGSATQIEIKIKLLNYIDNSNFDEAKLLLENTLDAELSGLYAYANKSPFKPNKEVNDAIKIAKQYRDKHPSHIVNPNLYPAVRKVLAIAKSE